MRGGRINGSLHFVITEVFSLLSIVFKILNNPGPGAYQPIDGINIDGMYAMSGHMRTSTPNIRKN